MASCSISRSFGLGARFEARRSRQDARRQAGWLVRRLQNGEALSMPKSRPMPGIGPRCHELRIARPRDREDLAHHLPSRPRRDCRRRFIRKEARRQRRELRSNAQHGVSGSTTHPPRRHCNEARETPPARGPRLEVRLCKRVPQPHRRRCRVHRAPPLPRGPPHQTRESPSATPKPKSPTSSAPVNPASPKWKPATQASPSTSSSAPSSPSA